MATLFRNAVINAMPQAVKNRLEDVVGLNSKTHNELCDHVSRAVEQHRNKTHKLKSQEKEIQRKLTQLQLEELTKRNKTIIKATIKKEESEQITLKSSVNAPPIAIQPSQPAAVPLNVHQIPVPIINVYTQQPEPMGWKRQPVQRGQRRKEARLILVLQVCAGDVNNSDVTKLTVPPIHGNSHLREEEGRDGSSPPRVHHKAQ